MKKALLPLLFLCFGLFSTQANASMYHLDNDAVDQMFAQAEQVDMLAMHSMAPTAANATFVAQEKDPVIAFILAWFLGPLGIHRAYLGTSTGTIIGYILTAGGCGIIAFVDWVLLLIGLINDDISQYVNNPRFFMW